MDSNSIRDRLISLPEEIKKKQVEVTSLSLTFEEKKKSSKVIETNIAGKVASNKSLTNDTMRKAAILEEINNDAAYQGYLTDILIIEGKLKSEQIELDYLHNIFRALITIASMKGVE